LDNLNDDGDINTAWEISGYQNQLQSVIVDGSRTNYGVRNIKTFRSKEAG
jgi:hypothetical protein